MQIGAGIGDDAAVFQRGTDAALELTGLLIKEGRRQADEALATLGKVCAQYEVQLAACTGNVLDAGALRIHLAEQVDVHRIVDGDEVVQCGDAADVVGVIDGSRHTLGVVVEVVVHLLGAGTEGVDLTALVQLLVCAGDLAGLGDVHESVNVHLGVDAQVLQIALGDEAADGVGHTADAQLQAGTVGDLRNDEVCDLQIDLGGGAGSGHLADGRIVALHDAGDLGDMDTVFHTTEAAGHIGVDLHDDLPGLLTDGTQMGSAGAEVEVAVLVHRSHLEDGDVQRVGTLAVVAGQLRIADGGVEREALCDGFALNAAHVPAVPGHVGSGVVDLEDLRHPHQDAAAEIDVFQFGQALGKGGVHGHGGVDAPAVIHPVAALDQRSSLLGSHLFLGIHFHEIHYKPSSPLRT